MNAVVISCASCSGELPVGTKPVVGLLLPDVTTTTTAAAAAITTAATAAMMTFRLLPLLPPPAVARTRAWRDYRDVLAAEYSNGHAALASFWRPVALCSEVGPAPVAVRLGGRGWALARFGDGIAAFADACPHRRARLSAG